MKHRHVRIVLPWVEAVFGDRRCQLLDLSVTGGLILLDVAPTVDSTSTLKLEAGHQTLRLEARVVRVVPALVTRNPGTTPRQWKAGLRFLDGSPGAQQTIAKVCSQLLAAGRQRS